MIDTGGLDHRDETESRFRRQVYADDSSSESW